MIRLERELRLTDLIVALKNDHREIRRQLWILHILVSRGDYEVAEKRTIELQTLLGAHFAKEESRVRDVLSGTPSFSSFFASLNTSSFNNGNVIESAIQNHKLMSNSFKEIYESATISSREEKLSVFEKFERVLLHCIEEEEDRDLFPFLIWAIDESRKTGQSQNSKKGTVERSSEDSKPNGEKNEKTEELVFV
jgi:hypothetical protein